MAEQDPLVIFAVTIADLLRSTLYKFDITLIFYSDVNISVVSASLKVRTFLGSR